jgi:hypothetical protein
MAVTPDFHADFYVAAATVVPVVWLTAGLASQATSGVMSLLARVEYSSDRSRFLFPLIYQVFSSDKKLGPLRHIPIFLVSRLVMMPAYMSSVRILAMGVFVVSGVTGESLSLFALALEDPSRNLRIATLIFTLAVVGLGAALLAISLWNVAYPFALVAKQRRSRWAVSKEQILQAVRVGDKAKYQELLQEIFDELEPEGESDADSGSK